MRLGQVFSFLTSFGFMLVAPAIGYAAEAAEKKAGVPQLDPTYYPSQVFWLLVCFVLMYVLMAKVALPPVANALEKRDDKVRRDLENAHRARTESEEIKSLYNRSLRDADEEARSFINQIVQQAKTKHEKSLSETQERLADKISETEQFLASETASMQKEIPAMADRLGGTILGELKKAA